MRSIVFIYLATAIYNQPALGSFDSQRLANETLVHIFQYLDPKSYGLASQSDPQFLNLCLNHKKTHQRSLLAKGRIFFAYEINQPMIRQLAENDIIGLESLTLQMIDQLIDQSKHSPETTIASLLIWNQVWFHILDQIFVQLAKKVEQKYRKPLMKRVQRIINSRFYLDLQNEYSFQISSRSINKSILMLQDQVADFVWQNNEEQEDIEMHGIHLDNFSTKITPIIRQRVAICFFKFVQRLSEYSQRKDIQTECLSEKTIYQTLLEEIEIGLKNHTFDFDPIRNTVHQWFEPHKNRTLTSLLYPIIKLLELEEAIYQ